MSKNKEFVKKILLVISILALQFSTILSAQDTHNQHNSKQKHPNKYEWRAVWISTVNNIDWPSKPGLDSEQQKKELIEYLDLFDSLNFNAVILQIRPTADAFYSSEYEPWSIYLTGNQDTAPEPFYDPLKFAIEQAHKRGLELHAWLNPYRITQDTANLKTFSPKHIYNTNPELFVKHGKKCYFDPAFPESRDFLERVVKDIVRRYDLDGIHFDDYFYPDNDFIDSVSFSIHNRGYDTTQKAAWRRENVNLLVEQISKGVKEVKPYIKFGISPFAVWRNKREDPRGSDTKAYSYTNYDNLHADVLHWMEQKWVDYILPQYYFSIGYEILDFITIKDWWANNSYGVPLYAGLGSYRLEKEAAQPGFRSNREIANQIDSIRNTSGHYGVCFFTANNFKNNKMDINSIIKEKFNAPAISPNILPDNQKYSTAHTPTNVTSKLVKDKRLGKVELKLSWDKIPSSYFFVVYRTPKGSTLDTNNPTNIVQISNLNSYTYNGNDVEKYDYYVTALSRYAKESEPIQIKHNNKRDK